MNTTIDYDSLTLRDYLDELPPSNQLKWQPKNKTLANGKIIKVSGYMTNCVAAGHDDFDPSLHLYEGDKRIVHHCYSCGNRESINSYFHNKFLKRFNADGSYASNATKEEDALEDLKKRVQKQVEYKKWLLGEKDEL
ncbi:MAG: hypothetical protein QGF31_07650 [Nitrospinota bacterium]|jgi:hypothetical protein|nr:hypothetical protein [Nitrospinota bacterium]|tara:strand:+ start:495 stop:905 length:411 start_codon:yes stop_codon:yes gene_type:complete